MRICGLSSSFRYFNYCLLICELYEVPVEYQGYFLLCHWLAALCVTLFQLPVMLGWEPLLGTTSNLGRP